MSFSNPEHTKAMKHEKTIKRESGDQHKIDVDFWVDGYNDNFKMVWTVSVWRKEKRKQKWIHVHSSDDYMYRRLDADGRRKHELEAFLKHVSTEEILEAKLELWNKLKPE